MANLYDRVRKEIRKGGGIAKSNQFEVTIPDVTGAFFADIPDFDQESLSVFFSNVSLPSIQASTGQVNGYYTGHSFKYPTMKMYNDLSLQFICDANMTAYKFFNAWFDNIFSDYDKSGNPEQIDTSILHFPTRVRNRYTRLRYPDEYCRTVVVDKFEPGPTHPKQGRSMRYWFTKAYPYSIDAVPLDAGASTLLQCSVNIYYERFEVQFADTRTHLENPNRGIISNPRRMSDAIRNVGDSFKSLTTDLGKIFS